MSAVSPSSANSPEDRAPFARWQRPRAYAELFLISFNILFMELACIRWFGCTVVFLTFFTNLVLMACFLGMTVGCLAASRKADLINRVIPMTLFSVVLSLVMLWVYNMNRHLTIDVGGQQSPQQIFFGTETRPKDLSRFVIPVEVICGVFFALIAVTFVGLGQALGRRFDALPNRVGAYTADVLGSLAGIAAFGAASHARTSPPLWFAISLGLTLVFVTRHRVVQALGVVGVLLILVMVPRLMDGRAQAVWSPYYKIHYDKYQRYIYVNNIQHQGMVRIETSGSAYALPYLLNRDAGGKPFDDVMIIGAGSGNDVATALAMGSKHVDAVEIDPYIQEIGRAHHPNHPYEDPRVDFHLDDGRSFIHKTGRKYDLIVFALVDSLVLQSSYSSLRLESFLFTEEAFRDIKTKLKPGGVFAMYNLYRQGWVIGRLDQMAENVFGAPPIVMALPFRDRIASRDAQRHQFTFLLTGDPDSPKLRGIREAFARDRFFRLYDPPSLNMDINAYGPEPTGASGPIGKWQRIGPAEIDTRGVNRLPSDDWPFLYLRDPTIPWLNVRGMAIVAAVSFAILFAFAPIRTARPSLPMFFLGAGFMLLETKGVVHMALLFGSTWVVNSIVFFAILVMILMSNLYVMAVKPRKLWPYYALLIATLLVNAYVPMATFLALPGAARVAVSCLVVYLPVFFAGVIFATTFRDSRRPDVDFGSNIGGVILGGLCENLSLVVGFNHLLLVAMGFYVLSAVFRKKGED